MATDALTAATEELAPARATTNFFDPTQGANVIARYANARIAAEGANAAAEGASARLEGANALNRSRLERAAARRQAMMFDRDEKEYAEKTDYKAQRGQFLDTVSSIDPTADDYDTQISSFLKDLPMGVREDDALQAIITHKNRAADSFRTEREMEARRKEQFDNTAALMKMRYENDPKLAALSPEERNSFVQPDGTFDVYGARNLAYEKDRTNKKDDSKELTAAKEERKAVKSAELDRRRSVMKVGVADQGAFPSQLDAFITAHPKFDPKDIDTSDPKEVEKLRNYNSAATYESKKLESEMASALNYENPDEYVGLVTKASPAQKKKRRDLWNLAHEMAGNAAPDAPAAKAPKPIAADKLVVGKRYLGANGESRTYKGEGKWE